MKKYMWSQSHFVEQYSCPWFYEIPVHVSSLRNLILYYFGFPALSELRCTDHFGKEISNGQVFQPKPDPCYQCTCSDGFPTMCKSVSCIPPTGCLNPVMIDDKCCKFRCEDDGGGGHGQFPPTNATDPTKNNDANGLSFFFVGFYILLLALNFCPLIPFKNNVLVYEKRGTLAGTVHQLVDMLKCSFPLMVVFSYVNFLSTYFSVSGKIFLTLGYSSATSNLGIVALGLVQFQGHFFFISLY